MTSQIRFLSACFCAIFLFVHGPAAMAASDAAKPTAAEKRKAQTHFKRGVGLYQEADFKAALIEFRRAYDTAPHPKVLYNIGQSYFQLQDYARALNAFQQYLEDAGPTLAAAKRKKVEADIEKLKTRVARLTLVTDVAGARVMIDGESIGETPLTHPITVSAGERRLVVKKSGYAPFSERVELAGGDEREVRVVLEASEKSEPAPSPVPAEPSAGGKAVARSEPPIPPLVPWVAAGVFAAGAVTTGILTLNASSDAHDKEDNFGESRTSLDDAEGKVKTLALVTDVLAGAAILSGGVALYLTLAYDSDSAEESEKPASGSVDVGFSPRGVLVMGRF